MGLTARQRGRERDATILRLVGQFSYLRADQVAQLVCGGRLRVANRRLLRLVEDNHLSRFALGRNDAYVYCLPGRRRDPVTAAHPLMVATIYCALVASPPPPAALEALQPEYEAGATYRADALLVATFGERRLAVFLEVDLATEHVSTVARKVEALGTYHASGSYRQAPWWRQGVEVFQLITTPSARVAQLRPAVTATAARTGVRATVVDQAEVTVRPWAVLSRLIEEPDERPVIQPARATTALAPSPTRPTYRPAWTRCADAIPSSRGAQARNHNALERPGTANPPTS